MMGAYKDLLLEIDILSALHADLVRQLEQQHRVVWSGMAPSDPMPVHVPLDRSVSQYNSLVERLTAAEEELRVKRELRAEIDAKLAQMTGIKYRVMYDRYVEGKTLQQIADDTGYSVGYLKNMSANL